jgi:RNA polymerase sigma-B factor
MSMAGYSRNAAQDQARERETSEVIARLRHCDDPAEERRLRQQLVVLNVAVATGIALRYRGRGEAIEDLVQAAHLGLVKAANGFDPHRGPDFLSYAVPNISGEVKRHFRDQGWGIRPPRRVQELRPDVEAASSELTQKLGRSPKVGEIARHLRVSEDDIIECIASTDLYNVHSLDAPVAGAQDLAVSDTVGEVEPLMNQIEDVLSVRPLLDRLSPRDRRILALRFFAEWTQQQIADEVGVTQMQVSRLITRALRTLREGLEDEGSGQPEPGQKYANPA